MSAPYDATGPLPREALAAIVAAHAYPVAFATVSGAHLYGFASPDSDFDLRGSHVLPAAAVLGLRRGPDTLQEMSDREGLDLDLVTHDLEKFMRLLLKPNGYVLEQLLSPLVVATGELHAAMVALAPRLVTRFHARHYLGFARNQWKRASGAVPEVKPLLYTYRVLRTGLHLMETGEVVADLGALDAAAPRPGVAELLARKRGGREHEPLDAGEAEAHRRQVEALEAELLAAQEASALPAKVDEGVKDALSDLLVRARLGELR